MGVLIVPAQINTDYLRIQLLPSLRRISGVAQTAVLFTTCPGRPP